MPHFSHIASAFCGADAAYMQRGNGAIRHDVGSEGLTGFGEVARTSVSSARRPKPVRLFFAAGAAIGSLTLAQCAQAPTVAQTVAVGVPANPQVVDQAGSIDPAIARKGVYLVGKPYVIGGHRFVPKEYTHYTAEGMASWYGNDFHGRLTANGEIYDRWTISAAHPTMPLPSYARVTNEENGRSIVVRVNDRGPFHSRRLIDVSSRAADLLDMKRRGVGRVKVEYIGRAQQNGSDNSMLMATLRTDGSAAPAPAPILVAAATQAPMPVLNTDAPAAAAPMIQPTRPVFAAMSSTGLAGGSASAPMPVAPGGNQALDIETIGSAATPITGAVHAGSIPLPPVRADQRSAEADISALPHGQSTSGGSAGAALAFISDGTAGSFQGSN